MPLRATEHRRHHARRCAGRTEHGVSGWSLETRSQISGDAAILDFGIIKAKIAGDYIRESPREQQPERKDRSISRGVVGSVQVVVESLPEAAVSGGLRSEGRIRLAYAF